MSGTSSSQLGISPLLLWLMFPWHCILRVIELALVWECTEYVGSQCVQGVARHPPLGRQPPPRPPPITSLHCYTSDLANRKLKEVN